MANKNTKMRSANRRRAKQRAYELKKELETSSAEERFVDEVAQPRIFGPGTSIHPDANTLEHTKMAIEAVLNLLSPIEAILPAAFLAHILDASTPASIPAQRVAVPSEAVQTPDHQHTGHSSPSTPSQPKTKILRLTNIPPFIPPRDRLSTQRVISPTTTLDPAAPPLIPRPSSSSSHVSPSTAQNGMRVLSTTDWKLLLLRAKLFDTERHLSIAQRNLEMQKSAVERYSRKLAAATEELEMSKAATGGIASWKVRNERLMAERWLEEAVEAVVRGAGWLKKEEERVEEARGRVEGVEREIAEAGEFA